MAAKPPGTHRRSPCGENLVGASSFTIGTINRQVCYLRGITWLHAYLLFLCVVPLVILWPTCALCTLHLVLVVLMDRCEAITKAGRRCRNHASAGSDFCARHANEVSPSGIGVALVGAALGHAIFPGVGGAVLGSAAGTIARRLYKTSCAQKKRVFVSFDFDNDRALKAFILGQAKLPDSPFEVVDHSLNEAAPDHKWESKARSAIKKSDLVLVVVGRHTYRAHGVLKEVQMAREEDVPIVQIIGYRDGKYTPVANAGRLYAWNWDNLKRLLG